MTPQQVEDRRQFAQDLSHEYAVRFLAGDPFAETGFLTLQNVLQLPYGAAPPVDIPAERVPSYGGRSGDLAGGYRRHVDTDRIGARRRAECSGSHSRSAPHSAVAAPCPRS